MAPTAVLDDSTTTRITMTTASHNTQSIPTRSNDQHVFGVHQLMAIGASNAIIRPLVPVPISAFPYCKALITKLFFRQILGHAASPSISFSDLVTSVDIYFDMSMAITEREVEKAVDSIRDSSFHVTNMFTVGFLNSKGKKVAITDPSHHPDDITYFTFLANINPHLVDTPAPDSVNISEFSLRLPHTFLSPSESLSVGNSVPINTMLILSTLLCVKCLTTICNLCRHLKFDNYFLQDEILFPHQVLRTHLELYNLRLLLFRYRQWHRL